MRELNKKKKDANKGKLCGFLCVTCCIISVIENVSGFKDFHWEQDKDTWNCNK